jgi:hypothetical protein
VWKWIIAGLAIAVPAASHAANYDGRWSVSVVTRSGACDSYRWNIGIRSGKVTDVEGRTAATAGGIASNGKVDIRMTRGSDTLRATGSASGSSAAGTWSSPSRQCSGTWEARKS